ncbi:ABC transporter ATP-binding protein [Streptococcus ratti]|uniref:ABC transporter ATP-binding protein n=1 Tax=Streptococcus ratti FA-1 = DSM 20564 TaxID=699248 RepID=A0ABN0GVH5_STRRT|nr:ABC transporter ATP-binding protein [Streptococcus ratti]EJN94308.1 ABC transporter ATP-binding protein [Streptococcus ratti FA-1 = DSM 20564]QEY06260.1 ABC transporter ATP-binding protein [Streptococcus ratti]VEI60601.1 ABC transporter ATP-binding protein [Streptococcus mutans]
MTNVIEVRDLVKRFGDQAALDGISFEIKEGEIFGFLGPSGSGKTTTINILTGQLLINSGSAKIFGKEVLALDSEDLAQIGIVSDTSGFYEKMTLYKNIQVYSKWHGVSNSRVDELLQRIGLYESRNKPAEKLSTGMKQRMLLVRALINRPKFLFLDEPTSGLDPATSRMIHDWLLELKEEGTTIFLTTHDMQEATLLCDRVSLLYQGKLVETGRPKDLIQKYYQDKRVRLLYTDGHEVELPYSELSQLEQVDEIETIHSCEPTLEDIFISLTGGKLNV